MQLTLTRRHLFRIAGAQTALLLGARAIAAQEVVPALPFALTTPIRVGEAALRVRDLRMMTDWYADALGLAILSEDAGGAVLGAGGVPLLHLIARAGASFESSIQAGLYHIAFLMPDRTELARWLVHAAFRELPVTGASDHAVSEAIYLNDPEGNGLEVYADRDPAIWQWQDGRVTMGSVALDVPGLAALVDTSRDTFTGAPDAMRIGHMHLRVGDVERGKAFYQAALGLDLTSQRDPSAAFLASGGYHHHVALNMWQSFGAGLRNPGATGLDWFSLRHDSADLIDAGATALEEAGVTPTAVDGGWQDADPWGTMVRLLPA